MPINLELKIKLNSHDELLNNINKNQIKFIGVLIQKDIFYQFGKGFLKLRMQNGEYELIKYIRNENRGHRWSNYSVVKLSGENIELFIGELFEEEIIVEKRRDLYKFKNTRIHLDEVKDLGKFIELETVATNISKEEAVLEFNEIIGILNLDMKHEIRASYRDLLLERSNP